METIRNNQTGKIHFAHERNQTSLCGMLTHIDSRIATGSCLEASLGRGINHQRRLVTCAACLRIERGLK